mmetsp:Transcript_10171/g.26399  ORF Transcript_10171/g.26399 Transcript_10171/m.26399 type:complete len:104 (+) Transcript_10171:29-340(+)
MLTAARARSSEEEVQALVVGSKAGARLTPSGNMFKSPRTSIIGENGIVAGESYGLVVENGLVAQNGLVVENGLVNPSIDPIKNESTTFLLAPVSPARSFAPSF